MSPYLNVLVAYPYMSKGIIKQLEKAHKEIPIRFLLDSGAFTAFNSGKEITLDDYCSFLENLPFKPWKYFALDVIGNPEKTKENYDKMLERGFTPAPIFTFGEDLSAIDEMYKTSDFIGVGGLVGVPKNKMLNSLDKSLKKINGRPAHLLGFTQIEFLKKFNPYSADSSSWLSGTRFGFTDVYTRGKLIKVGRKDIINKPPEKIIKAIEKLGILPKELAFKKGWTGGNSTIHSLSARSWVKMSLEIEKRINTKLFLAYATEQAGNILLDSYKFLTKDNK